MKGGDLTLKELRKRYEESGDERFLQRLADMGRVKVPFKILRQEDRKIIFDSSRSREIREKMKNLGEERLNEFTDWVEGAKGKYFYMLPQVLGENFSFNILELFWVVFLRYIYNRFLEEKEKNTPFVKKLLETRLIEDILREGLWYKKAPSFLQRPLGFRMHPANIRKEGGKLVVVFLKALLNTPFVCGKEEPV